MRLIFLTICCCFFYTYGTDTYKIRDDIIVFKVRQLRSIPKNNDKSISRFIQKIQSRNSCEVNVFGNISAKKGYYVLFFWKVFNKNIYGFVVAERVNADMWRVRLNSQNVWSKLYAGENESFKWFANGRSVSVRLSNSQPDKITFIFSGEVDF